jgi:predicted PurR-regulated permease PerM
MYICPTREIPEGIQSVMSLARSTDLPRTQPLLLLAATVLVLFFARDLFIPFAFALTLAFLLAPAVSRLEAHRVPRVISVALIAILCFGSLAAIGYVVSRQLLDVAQTLPAYRLNIQNKMSHVHSSTAQEVEKAASALDDISGVFAPGPALGTPVAPPATPVRIVDPNRSQIQTTAEFLLRFLHPIGVAGVVIVFTIYLLMKREDLRHRILLLAGMGRINVMTQAFQDAASRISQYLVLQSAVNATYGLLFGAGLFLIGVPNATLWGVLAGILRIIPYVGTTTSLVLPLIVSVAVFSSWLQPLLILALFLVLELTATNFVEPWLYSTRTGISSLALLAMAIFWTLLWGWPGLILSTPLTVCIVVLGRYVPQMSFLHTLLGTDAELSAEAHFYERLLAMDQPEAYAIANRYLEGKPLVQLYDTVLIPALSLVEQDRHQGLLDDVRCNFFFLTIGELVAKLTDYKEQLPVITTNNNHSVYPEARNQPPPQEFAIVCISASDQADELTSLMLGQLMERAAHQTILLAASTVSPEVLDSLAREPNTVVIISALPPFAFSQARTICQRVRARLPENRIVIGLWDPNDDPDLTIERFGSGRPTVVVNSLSQALNQIAQWHRGTTQVS